MSSTNPIVEAADNDNTAPERALPATRLSAQTAQAATRLDEVVPPVNSESANSDFVNLDEAGGIPIDVPLPNDRVPVRDVVIPEPEIPLPAQTLPETPSTASAPLDNPSQVQSSSPAPLAVQLNAPLAAPLDSNDATNSPLMPTPVMDVNQYGNWRDSYDWSNMPPEDLLEATSIMRGAVPPSVQNRIPDPAEVPNSGLPGTPEVRVRNNFAIAPIGQHQVYNGAFQQQQLQQMTEQAGESVSLQNINGTVPNAVLPNPTDSVNAFVNPQVVFAPAEGFQRRTAISTNLADYDQYIRRPPTPQELMRQLRANTGADASREASGDLAPIDMASMFSPRNREGVVKPNGLFESLSNIWGAVTSGRWQDARLDLGDFGDQWWSPLLYGFGQIDNVPLGFILDGADSLASTFGGTSLKSDNDPTPFVLRALRGDDLGFSNYGSMNSGRQNPLGLWGNESDKGVEEAFLGFALKSIAFPFARETLAERIVMGQRIFNGEVRPQRAGLMALGLVLDVVTNPSDIVKIAGRISRAGRVGEAAQAVQETERIANSIPNTSALAIRQPFAAPQPPTSNLVSRNPFSERRVNDATIARSGAIERSDLPVYDLPPEEFRQMILDLDPESAARFHSELSNHVNRYGETTVAPYYSPSGIVNEVYNSSNAVPTAFTGNPNFYRQLPQNAGNAVIDVIGEVVPPGTFNTWDNLDSVAVSLRKTDEAGNPLTTLQSIPDISVVNAVDLVNNVINPLAPVSRRGVTLPRLNQELAVDPVTIAETLPRPVSEATLRRMRNINEIPAREPYTVNTRVPAVFAERGEGLILPKLRNALPLSDMLRTVDAADASDIVNRVDSWIETAAERGIRLKTPDYSGFVVTKNGDVSYTNMRNLTLDDNALTKLADEIPRYQRLAQNVNNLTRATRLLEVMQPSAMRTPDMLNELLTGVVPPLPKGFVPQRNLLEATDDYVAAQERFSNATRVLQRVEAEYYNIGDALPNRRFDTAMLNRDMTVFRTRSGVVRESATAAREVQALQDLDGLDFMLPLKRQRPDIGPNTYEVTKAPKGSEPLVKNGRLNLPPENLDVDFLQGMAEQLADRGYVHYNLVDSVSYTPDGRYIVTDDYSAIQKIDDTFGGKATPDEIAMVRQVEADLVNRRIDELTRNFDIDSFELGNPPRYQEGSFNRSIDRIVNEYNRAPEMHAAPLRQQVKYELGRETQLAKREAEAALTSLENAQKRVQSIAETARNRHEVLTQEAAIRRQRKLDETMSRNGTQCI